MTKKSSKKITVKTYDETGWYGMTYYPTRQEIVLEFLADLNFWDVYTSSSFFITTEEAQKIKNNKDLDEIAKKYIQEWTERTGYPVYILKKSQEKNNKE